MGRYRAARPQGSKYITPEGARALQEELDYLWRRKRPEVTRAVGEAAAQGDRSENAEYIYGKKQLAEIDRRIRHLRKRLDGMQVIAGPPADPGKIRFGAWFALRDAGGELERFRLVGPDELDPAQRHVSMDSPLGRAVMGKAEGERVEVPAPGGTAHYTVAEISYRGAPDGPRAPDRPDQKKARPGRASHRGNR